LRTTVEGAWDTSGFSLAGVMALADHEAELVGWIMRQGGVTASEAARHAGEDEPAVTARLRALAEQGLVQETEAGSRFTARLAPRRRRALPEDIWSALGQEPEPRDPTGAARHRSPHWQAVRGALLGRRGRFMLGAAPVFACFAVTEWLILTGSGSFAGLIGFIGVIVSSLMAGIFPVLLLVASRRKGEYMPRPVHRLLGHPLLLGGLYLLFLGNVLVHGLVIWKEPWLRVGAVLVAAGIVSMTARMISNGTFSRRLNIEVREDQAEGRTFFAVTADGQESTSSITLKYGESERHLQAGAGEIPAFSSLRHAVFESGLAPAPRQTPRQLKVRVHKVTSDGDSEPIGGSITVQTGDATKRYDIKLAKGQVILPLNGATCRVDIEPTDIAKTNQTTMTGTAKGDPSGVSIVTGQMPMNAAVAQAVAATAVLFTDSRAGSGGRALVSRAGMSEVRAARSAQVRPGPRRQRPAHPQVKLVPVQPSMHERGLEHLDHLLAVGVRRPQAATAARTCCYLVTRPRHPGASP
jgi:hypothetical protein